MAEQNTSKKGWHSLLEFAPILLFFVGYFVLKDEVFVVNGVEYAGFVAVTAMFVPACLVFMAIYWHLVGRLAVMQVVTLVFVVVFGGLTVIFNDEWFFKTKPTIIYLLFAAILGAGLLKGRSFLQIALDGALPLSKAGWVVITRHTMIFCLALALANELIARNLSTDMWVYFKTFGFPIFTALFFGLDTFFIIKDSNQEQKGSDVTD